MTTFQIGLPNLHKEAGERRAFLPSFIARLQRYGAQIYLEEGYGAGMGYTADDYLRAAGGVRFVEHTQVYQQPCVLVLRCPAETELRLMQPGACLISMLHYPTRPGRVALLHSLGLEAISLDSIKDDTGRRLVENLRAVGWNGLEAAFQALAPIYPAPGFTSPQRPPIRVTLLGAGAVGSHVMQAAVRYGSDALRSQLASAGVPGVQVTVVDYDLTGHAAYMEPILRRTDILVDATQRPDPSLPVIPNAWVAWLPEHAVIVDLSVDPYDCTPESRSVKGVEGIPQGNLDQYVFAPDDPVYTTLGGCFETHHRRHVVSCYSWPGVHPKECMQIYGRQLRPLLRTIIEKGSWAAIKPTGQYFERALNRAMLSRWSGG